MELKLVNNWTGPQLFERIEDQLNGDYLRDGRSSRGIFVLVNGAGKKKFWEIPGKKEKVTFSVLVSALQDHWDAISIRYPKTEQIAVIGIDLKKRMQTLSLVTANQ